MIDITLIQISIIVAIIVIYYSLLLNYVRGSLVASLTEKISSRLSFGQRHSLGDIEGLTTLVVSVVMQIMLFFALALCVDFDLSQFFTEPFQPVLLLFGAVLGIGEMALASLLGLIAMRVAMVIAPASPTRLHHWYVLVNSGWMRLFNKAIELLPRPASFVLVGLYVAVEEMIYRGIVLTVLLPLGEVWAVLISTAIFAGYQLFNMPTLRAAMFPVVGAVMMGLVHGWLYVTIPDIWPLVVAHIVYFMVVAGSFD